MVKVSVTSKKEVKLILARSESVILGLANLVKENDCAGNLNWAVVKDIIEDIRFLRKEGLREDATV